MKQIKFTTLLPANIFFRINFSLVANIMYCIENETISIQFYCDSANRLKKIEILHNDPNMLARLNCLQDCRFSYSKNILRWHLLEKFFQELGIAVENNDTKLAIIFPTHTTIDLNILCHEGVFQKEMVKH